MARTIARLAIITGASQGIGLAAATRFIQQGYRVINIARKACPVSDVVNCLADLCNSQAIQDIESQLKPLLKNAASITLVHNAMSIVHDDIHTLDPANLRALFEIGIVAPAQLNQICLPFMNESSSIIYIGSTLSTKAIPNAVSYITQKHALIGLMRATCQDLIGSGIHTACICPGFTDTNMLHAHVPAEKLESVLEIVAGKRLVKPGEIAEVILFCAENPALNGSVLHANLGQAES